MKRKTILKGVSLIAVCTLSLLLSCSDEVLTNMEATQTQEKKPGKHKNEELTVSVAKQWYEANYEPVVTTRAYYEDTTACMMKPQWDAAKESNRKRYEVVELPILTKHKRLMMDRETYRNWKPEAQFNFVRNTAKLVVLYDKKTQDTRSFFMIFVGSYKYLQKTRNMGKNSYLYREPDFDGKVLFYELNGTFINGWKYTNGKITGSIAPVMEENTDKPQSRAWVEDCYTDYDYEIEQVCEDDYYIEYDEEYGESYVIESHCWDEYVQVPYEVCDEYWEEDEDNWEEDYPIGGSNTSHNGGNDNTEDDAEKERQEKFEKSMTQIKSILANKGIDISKYKIVLGNFCATNARTLPDNTIELCEKAFRYSFQDQASIIWHEIYHVEHNHNIDWEYTSCDPPLILKLDDEIRPFFNTLLENEFDGYGTPEQYANEMMLSVPSLMPEEWYKNEIETYEAELGNEIPRTEAYEADLHFMLWKYQELYNYTNQK